MDHTHTYEGEQGFGYIDVHLSVSALVTAVPMGTRDKRPDAVNQSFAMTSRPLSVG